MMRGLRPKKSKAKWYVSFEPKGPTKGTRTHTRLAETFQTEQEAKAFARAKLAEGLNVSAGTLNPHLPKRMISSIQLRDWLTQPDL
jgi:predicted chitinase